jgi:hypothetical protein
MTASLKGSRRGVRVLGIASMLAVAGVVRAQTTGTLVGTVSDGATGKPVAGALVIATSPGLQGEQTAVTDTGGHYLITLLPPGRYRVAAQVQGYQPAHRSGLALRVDFTLRANLVLTPEAVEVEPQVVRSGISPAVNVGSAEQGGVISREFLATVPTTRDYQGTLIVLPTALRDVGGISLAGASSIENNYILDGFRVAEPATGWLGSNMLTNIIEQIDVKTAGFMPEYGYASGGVVNTVLKSGSNEFHGSVWGNLSPGLLSPASDVVTRNGQAIASYRSPYKGAYATDFGLEVGGPIVKDRLWFYAGLAAKLDYDVRTGFYQSRVPSAENPNVAQRDAYGNFVMQQIPGSEFVFGSGTNYLIGVGKLSWLVNESQNLSLSFNTTPGRGGGRKALYASGPAGVGGFDVNATDVVLAYGGKFLDKHLLVETNLGWYESPSSSRPAVVDGVDQAQTPSIYWQTLQPLQNFDPAVAGSCPYPSRQTGIGNAPGCYVQGYRTGGYGGYSDYTTRRLAGTASVTALFDLAGTHVLKGGVQIDYAQFNGTEGIFGGAFWDAWGRFLGPGVAGTGGSYDAFQMTAYGRVDPSSVLAQPGPRVYSNWCTSIVDGRCVNPGGKDPGQMGLVSVLSHNWSNGFYLQDAWTIANVLTLAFGVRLDTQVMTNASPDNSPWTPQLDLGSSWAPRVQAIWDFTGQGRGKIQATWGRYYESVPLSLAFSSLSSSPSISGAYQLSSCSAAMIPGPTSQGNPAVHCPNVYGIPEGTGPGPNTRTLGPSPLTRAGFTEQSPYFSPIAPGLQGQYTDQFGGGVQYEILQDLTLGVDYIGRRQGNVIESISTSDGSVWFTANPAVSKPWTVTEGPYAGTTFNPRNQVGFAASTGVAYLAEFPVPVRSYDSVTVSMNKLFSKRWLAQASYTWSSLRGNYSGLIRNDIGAVAPNGLGENGSASMMSNTSGPLSGNRTHQIKASGSYLVSLGEEVSLTPGLQFWAISGNPTNVWAFGDAENFLLPRGVAGELPWQTSLDLSAMLAWAVGGPYSLTFTISVFNVLNSQVATGVDQRYTLDEATSIQGAQCAAKNSVSQLDPTTALLANCPDLAYARTTGGLRVTPNLNYGRATSYQTPVSARFGVALSF